MERGRGTVRYKEDMKRLFILLAILVVIGVFLRLSESRSDSPTSLPVDVPTEVKPTEEPKELEEEVSLTTSPASVIQGEPFLVVVKGVDTTSSIKSLTLNGKSTRIFMRDGKVSAFFGVDLRMKPGTYSLILALADGSKVEKKIAVNERRMPRGELGIPDKLGGNTQEAEKQLVSNLASDGAQISAITTSNEPLWKGAFRFPVDGPVVVSDPYGYGRQTVGTVISHKGTDFKAPEGTPILAMNSGIVRFAKSLTTYGNTVVVDHGLGIHTIYMHLSEMNVSVGERVVSGQLLGKSGDTGYAFGPHLHLTVRINGISIDPIKFLELFGTRLI